MQLKYRGVTYRPNLLTAQHHGSVVSAIALSCRGRLYLLARIRNVCHSIDRES
jgi:hypothetical protein